ncbi:hypothetical protein ACSR9E_03625 [Citrobacter koseri]|uniref:hypothetical protein n=1 Tax=Citrobacter koseri TaxID=545 RepID=UPI0038916783
MNISISVSQGKEFVCAFVTSQENLDRAAEEYRDYSVPGGDASFLQTLIFILFSVAYEEGTEITTDTDVAKYIAHLVNEKNADGKKK